STSTRRSAGAGACSASSSPTPRRGRPTAPPRKDEHAMASASKLDVLRTGRSEIVNHHLDELAAGRLSRREFMRRGAAVGMSGTVLAAALAACGGANSSPSSASAGSGGAPRKGGTLKLASQTPTGAINPI